MTSAREYCRASLASDGVWRIGARRSRVTSSVEFQSSIIDLSNVSIPAGDPTEGWDGRPFGREK